MSSNLRPFIASLLFLPLALPAVAQDSGTYQLPPVTSTPPAVQGPVVPDAPPPRTAPTPEPEVTPSVAAAPSPAITLAPLPVPTTTSRPPPREAAARPDAPTAPSASQTAATPLPTEQGIDLPFESAPVPADTSPAVTSPPAPQGNGWKIAAAVALALMALGIAGAVALRRQKAQSSPDPVFERPQPHAAAEEELKPAAATPSIAPKPRDAVLAIQLKSLRMSVSLVNATLAYRLSLSSAEMRGPLDIRLQMAAAHASRPAEEQFGTGEVSPSHRLEAMTCDESVVLVGEIRLPLAAIMPIRQGNAALFVPLVRIDVRTANDEGLPQISKVFVVGIEDGDGGKRLQPFRLDLGPRVFARVGQRELMVPALV